MASSFVDFLSGVLPRGVPVCIFLIKEPDNEPIRGEMRLVKAKARYLSPNKNPNRIPRGILLGFLFGERYLAFAFTKRISPRMGSLSGSLIKKMHTGTPRGSTPERKSTKDEAMC